MKTRFLFAPLLSCLATALAAEPWPASRLRAEGLRHSAIALMPEGTPSDYGLFARLHPSIVAWGEEGLPALAGGEAARRRLEQKFADYRRLGIDHRATNVWMLTATQRHLHSHPALLEATCIDPWGERILPPWLADAEHEGTKPWWGCTNHPLFAGHLVARMSAGLAAGANLVHLDDHAGTAACAEFAGGCYCRHCLAGFRRWLAEKVTPTELAAAGVADPATFDYGAFVRRQGYAGRAEFLEAWSRRRVPLREQFIAFQRSAATAFVGRLQAEAERLAGRPVPFGVNAYNLLPARLLDARQIDYFANEVEHWDREDLVPPVVFRLGEALDRPVFATGTGGDWIAYRQAPAPTRVRGWIAQAHAFGQHFMYSWRKWGFSEKTGTQWTVVEPEVFAPITDFIAGNRELFDGFGNAAATGLLYSNADAAANRWGVREVSRALLDGGVAYRLVVAGDALLEKPLTEADLTPCRALVVPADVRLSEAQRDLLAAWEARGGRLEAWRDSAPQVAGLPGRIVITATRRIWALPRLRPGRAASSPVLVVHLLNRDYDAATDAFRKVERVRLSIPSAALGGPAHPTRVRYHRPGVAVADVPVQAGADGAIVLELPGPAIWGILTLE